MTFSELFERSWHVCEKYGYGCQNDNNGRPNLSLVPKADRPEARKPFVVASDKLAS